MKKLLSFILALFFAVALWGCSARTNMPNKGGNSSDMNSPATSKNENLLTRDEALDIALKKAGVEKESIRELEAELDRDGPRVVWEIDFESGNMEYSYDIHAESGEILEIDRDMD